VVVLAALTGIVVAACYVDANLDMTNVFEVGQGQRKVRRRAHSETEVVDESLESLAKNIQIWVEVEDRWKFTRTKTDFSVSLQGDASCLVGNSKLAWVVYSLPLRARVVGEKYAFIDKTRLE
jgi:hypothetical protein